MLLLDLGIWVGFGVMCALTRGFISLTSATRDLCASKAVSASDGSDGYWTEILVRKSNLEIFWLISTCVIFFNFR